MHRLKAFKVLFFLAATLFVAKPFLGFDTLVQSSYQLQDSNILVKAFSKRKPEDFEDALNQKAAIHYQLNNPVFILFCSIAGLLAIIFTLFKQYTSITGKLIRDISTGLNPSDHTYLLTGKLII